MKRILVVLMVALSLFSICGCTRCENIDKDTSGMSDTQLKNELFRLEKILLKELDNSDKNKHLRASIVQMHKDISDSTLSAFVRELILSTSELIKSNRDVKGICK